MHDADERLVLIAEIAGGHGVKGRARLRCFTEDPASVGQLKPVVDAAGNSYRLKMTGVWKSGIVAEIEGFRRREQVDAVAGTKLFVPRRALPAPAEEEFYHTDLIGLVAVTGDGLKLGVVKSVFDFGAGDLLEIAPEQGGATQLLPFTKAVVPEIDLAAGRLVVVVPTEIGGDEVEAGHTQAGPAGPEPVAGG